MAKNKNTGKTKVAKFPANGKISDTDLLKKIRELIAADSGNLFYTNHALDRMEERGFTRRQVDCCIQKGWVKEPNYYDHKNGNYVVSITRGCAGETIDVILAWCPEDNVVVITVY
ncbi:MAG: DUF4258 domain-containing protein [Pseudomonadota bacterium]|jgi:hypothetical protein|nr:DUF4258 domain-containing protein [Pseudomonadota bacterium]QKK04387.1 MAG: DUF4258 domain-containing protein [Pseudomonadota bacterium]